MGAKAMITRPGQVKCPGCDTWTGEKDLWGQKAHMEEHHPNIIARRLEGHQEVPGLRLFGGEAGPGPLRPRLSRLWAATMKYVAFTVFAVVGLYTFLLMRAFMGMH